MAEKRNQSYEQALAAQRNLDKGRALAHRQATMRRDAAEEARRRAFDEAKHPRHPAGTPEGGRFRPGDQVSGRLVLNPTVKVTGEVIGVHDAGLLVKTDNGEERLVSEQSAEHVGSSGLFSSADTLVDVSLTAAQFTERERERLAKSGAAMSDGSFPIRNRSDLRNAVRALGRAKDRAAAKRHIIARARKLGATDMLPEGWGVTASMTAASKRSPEYKAKVKKVLEEFQAGTLKSNGKVVTDKRQALAIALSEAKNLIADGFDGIAGLAHSGLAHSIGQRWSEDLHPRKKKGEKGGGRFDRKASKGAKKDNVVDMRDVLTLMDWTNPDLDKLAAAIVATAWDESKHPRDPGGEGGGQWVSGPGGEGRLSDNEVAQENASNPDDDLETRAQHYVAQGYQPVDGEPGEWITMQNPDTNHSITLDVNDEFDGQQALGDDMAMLEEEDQAQAEAYDAKPRTLDPESLPPELEAKAAEIVDSIGSRIEESMDIGEGVEGYGDEASQGRGYGDQVDEEIATAMDAYWDEFDLTDEETNALYPEVEKRLRMFLTQDPGATASALTAAAAGLAPVAPPKAWFDKPTLDGPTPITVTADGRIFGHAALWGTCHTGMSGTCRTPPRSESGYRFFHLGEIDTAEGEPVHVGRISMNTGHAPLTASRDATVRHYDDTGTGAAHVRAYEDEHGIVLAGAVMPDLRAEDARRLRGAPVSGDWRSIGGKLELVGMLAVNVPGFPVPRSMAASLLVEDEPHTMALVAAGMYCDPKDEARKLKALTARAKGLEGLYAAAMGGTDAERRMRGVVAASPFDPSKHPRVPGGQHGGGQWTRVTDRETGQTTYREGQPSQVIKDLRAEGVDTSTVKVAPIDRPPEEDARLRSGEPAQVQDTVQISKHGKTYNGTVKSVGPKNAMVEYTTDNGKTKTVAVPHSQYKVVDAPRVIAPPVATGPDREPAYLQTPNQVTNVDRMARAKASRNYNPALDTPAEPRIAKLADQVAGERTTPYGLKDSPGEVMRLLGVDRETGVKVSSEIHRRKRLEDIKSGRVVYTNGNV